LSVPVKWRGPFPWLAAAFAANVAVIVIAGAMLSRGPLVPESFTALILVTLAGSATLFAVSWKIVDFLVMRSICKMAAEVRAIAYGGERSGIDPARFAMISPLPEAVNEICARMVRARSELAAGLSVATRRSEENSNRLAAILNDLHEGVLVCNQRHQLVLYNEVAFDMLRATAELGLGRSLFETLSREPVVHIFDRLCGHLDRSARGVPFLAGTIDDRMLFQARMSLIRTGAGPVTGYVVTLVDAAPQLAGLAGRADLLREALETIDAPLARIAVAASEAPAVQRDCLDVSRAVRRLTEGYDRLLSSWWPMADIVSTELLSFVCSRLGTDIAATVIGLPVWLHGDSHSLVLAIEALVRRTAERLEIASVDLSAGAEGETAWVGFTWVGGMIELAELEEWLGQHLSALGGITLRDVLLHHAGAVPELRRTETGGGVRLPVPKAVETRRSERPALPSRPEFHDLSLLEQARETGALGSRPLKSLSFVVFDTETTGLQPSQGDRIVSIAGVRIVNGRILSGESFNRVVNPGRPIPVESIRFHGITDAMVREKPPAEVVLPQFHAYVADSVLVAHNAAFDLKFLRMNEQALGLRFDNPVLDTMILSSYLDGAEAGHSLDVICERYGVAITDRHTALGDAMVTAAVLLCQIEALEGRGIVTLDQAVKTLDIARILHDRQRVL